tara:strand:+ start:100 stop:261 length:162 start_codon:yes stop_codon:yes gene_type:complete
MEPLKVYGINITALFTTMAPLNQILQGIVLLLTAIYTILQIIKLLKNKKNGTS